MDRTFKIAVCNLQSGIGTTRGYWQYLTTGWKYGLPHDSRPVERAARFLREESIDVAALTEVEGGSRRSRGVDQLELLARKADMPEQLYFPTFVVGRRINQGNAVCSCLPLVQVHNHPLPGHGEPRFLSEAQFWLGDDPCRLFITHLSLELPVRAPQIHHIAELVGAEDVPTILAGDFNVKADAELELLEETILTKVTSAATFPSWKPRKALDHLFYSHHFQLVSASAFNRFTFSDHLPLVVQLRFSPAPIEL